MEINANDKIKYIYQNDWKKGFVKKAKEGIDNDV